MDTATAADLSMTTLVKRGVAGVIGGLVGGVLFGFVMQANDMLPMVAAVLDGGDPMTKSDADGWWVHLVISAIAGAGFGLLVGMLATTLERSLLLGQAYGLVWWVLGGLLIMPERIGMSEMTFELVPKGPWVSLAGHLIFGAVLGAVYCMIAPMLTAHRE